MKMKRNKYARWKNNWENGRWKTYVIIWRKSKERESKRDDSLNYVHTRLLSRVWLFATPRTVACQAPLYMGFSRQEYWSGLPFPPPGDLPDPEIKPALLEAPALVGKFFTTEPPAAAATAQEHGGCNSCDGQECACEELPHVQDYGRCLCFAGAAVKRYPMSKLRETQVRQ